MKCRDIKKFLTDFSEGFLPPDETQQVQEHLKSCADCQKELRKVNLVWDKLAAWQGIEPDPGYTSRFWTRVAKEKPWHEKTWDFLKPAFQIKTLAQAMVSICIIVIIGYLAFRPALQNYPIAVAKTDLTPEQVEFMENVDLVENLDVIEDIDFYEDMEYIKMLKV